MNNYNLHQYVLFSLKSSRFFISERMEDKLISMESDFTKEEISRIKEMIEDAVRWGYIEDEKSILLMYLRTKF